MIYLIHSKGKVDRRGQKVKRYDKRKNIEETQ